MQNCGIRNGGLGHELALKILSAGIKVLNYPKIIKDILYFKMISLKKAHIKCTPCCLATEEYRIYKESNFHNCVVARTKNRNLMDMAIELGMYMYNGQNNYVLYKKWAKYSLNNHRTEHGVLVCGTPF